MWFTALIPIAKWLIVGAVTYFTAKKGIEAFGSTPASRAEQLGIPKERLYEDFKKYKEDKKKYLTERNEEVNKDLKDDIEKLKKEIEKLEKQKTQQAKEYSEENDTGEKAKKLVELQKTEAELGATKKELSEKTKQMDKNNQDLAKIFDDLGAGANVSQLTEKQLTSRSKAPDLNAWKNWGIIAVVGIIAIFLVKMLFGLLKGVFKNVEG